MTAVKMTRLWVDSTAIGFGVRLYACFCSEQVAPVGFAWGMLFGAGNAGKTRFEVLGSYVVPWARRHGVRSAINAAIHGHADVITTQSGSKDGGLAFLKASGYTRDRKSGVWSLPAKRKRSRA